MTSSDYEDTDDEDTDDEETYDYTKKTPKTNINKYMIFIDSKDRRFIEEESTFSFPIMINNSNNTASLSESNIKNIKKIELIEVAIPNFYIDLKEVLFLDYNNVITSNKTTTNSNNLRMRRLIDLKYLHLELDSFHNYKNIGTNNSFKNKSFVLRLDEVEKKDNINSGYYMLNGNRYVEIGNINNSLVAGIDKSIISYKPHGEKSITIVDSEIKLQNMTLSIFNSDNNKLSLLNDTLTISTVTLVTGNTKILLKTTKLFSSEEYSIGDKIIIKPGTVTFSSTTNSFEGIQKFLERTEGHSIIGHYGASDGNPITETKLFKGIYIPTKFNYTHDSGTAHADIFTYHDFSLSLETEYSMDNTNIENNKLINLQNQILVTLKITTEQYTL